MSSIYSWQISTAFGLESLVRAELMNPRLALPAGAVQSVANGAVRVRGDANVLAKMQLWLRCAERISLVLSTFRAADFDDLFEGMSALAWEDILPWDAYIRVVCTLAGNASITSARSAQSIAKKAIIERLRACSGHSSFPESGESYSITIDIAADSAAVLLDSCGEGLHRRGYRLAAGIAPLRETTAAAMVYLADWKSEKEILWDPFCGSGTLAIEAAMMEADRAPGLMRYFSSETWPFLDASAFESERREAQERAEAGIARPAAIIRASDISPEVLSLADGNIRRAGMEGRIRLFKADARELTNPGGAVLFLTNPPYGERLGGEERFADGHIRGASSRQPDDRRADARLSDDRHSGPRRSDERCSDDAGAAEAGELLAGFFTSLEGLSADAKRSEAAAWRCALLSPERDLAGLGITQRYGKNRKLYNGKLRVWMYFFSGAPDSPPA